MERVHGGGGARAWDWGRGSGAERRSAPARWASSGRGKWEARKFAQARVGRSGALEAGSVSGRASQLCLRAIYYYTPLPLNLANNKQQQATSNNNNNTSPCRFGHCSVPTLRIICPCSHLGA